MYTLSSFLHRFVSLARTLAPSLTFALACVLTFSLPQQPAWSRGGGGGGGHGGGFGGGGHSFGGGGIGGGGFGGRGFGSHSYYGGGYYGGGYYGHGYYGSSMGYGYANQFFVWLLVFVVIVFVAVAISKLVAANKTLVMITMLMKNGRQYTSMMQRFTSSGDFSLPQNRTMVAHEVVHMINDADIFLGTVEVQRSARSGDTLGDQAKALWQEEMRRGDVKADIINVSSPSGKMKADFGPPSKYQDTAAELEDGYCLLSMIVTASGLWSTSSSQKGDVVNAIHKLAASEIDALYFYYTPSAGTSMTRSEGISVLEQVTSSR